MGANCPKPIRLTVRCVMLIFEKAPETKKVDGKKV